MTQPLALIGWVIGREGRRAVRAICLQSLLALPLRHSMGAAELLYILLPLAAGVLATAGGAVIALTPAEFRIARACFVSAALLIVGMVMMWGVLSSESAAIRLTVVGLVSALTVVSLTETLRWTTKRESLFSAAPDANHTNDERHPREPSSQNGAVTPNQPLIDRSKNEGVLKASNLPGPDLSSIPHLNSVRHFVVYYGSNAAVNLGVKSKIAVLEMGGQTIIEFTLDDTSTKIILTTLRLFDEQNKIMARIDENGFWVRPDTRKKWPDDSTLIVYNSADQQVLRLQFVNKNVITVGGIFHAPNSRPVVITEQEMKIIGGPTIRGASSAGSRVAIAIDTPRPPPTNPPAATPQAPAPPNTQTGK